MILFVLIVSCLFAYVFYRFVLAPHKDEQVPTSPPPPKVMEVKLDMNDFIKMGVHDRLSPDAYKAIFTVESLYQSLNRDREQYTSSMFYLLRNITRNVIELDQLVDKGVIQHSNSYNTLITEYNSVTDQYKLLVAELRQAARDRSKSSDVSHCPSCGEDIGKEVTRSRNCPKCKQRIILYRIDDRSSVLINRDIEQIITSITKKISDLTIPNLVEAYAYPDDVGDELEKRFASIDLGIQTERQASELSIKV